MFSGLFGKTEEPKEKLIRLIKKFEIDGTIRNCTTEFNG
jgi:hypothetical protein